MNWLSRDGEDCRLSNTRFKLLSDVQSQRLPLSCFQRWSGFVPAPHALHALHAPPAQFARSSRLLRSSHQLRSSCFSCSSRSFYAHASSVYIVGLTLSAMSHTLYSSLIIWELQPKGAQRDSDFWTSVSTVLWVTQQRDHEYPNSVRPLQLRSQCRTGNHHGHGVDHGSWKA